MKLEDIEKSIIKKYRKTIWRKFTEAINEFDLISDNDKIAVCMSGGKDSFLLAKCMQELKKHGKINFEVVFLLMDPGYSKIHMKKILKNAECLGITLSIFKSDIFELSKNTKSPCYMCARKRRGALYSEARKLGCNKIALGHHFNDVVETILMSIIFNGEFKTMKPVLSSVNYKPLKLIRPLYFIKEKDIIDWKNHCNLEFIDCACSVTKKNVSKRQEVKELVKLLNNYYKGADVNIMNSTKNVNLSTILSYKD